MEEKQSVVIAGVDFSEESARAAEVALNIARRKGAKVVLVHVGEPLGPKASRWPNEWEKMRSERDEESRQRLAVLQTQLSDRGVEVSQRVVDAAPGEGLSDTAEELGANLVVTGTHGRSGLGHFLVGSVAERTARLCACNTLVVRPGGKSEGGFEKVLVPTDFTPHAEAALREALLVAAAGATIELVHFWTLPAAKIAPWAPRLREEICSAAESQGQALISKYQSDRVKLRFDLVEARTAHGIVDRANADNNHYDAIIMGSQGHRSSRRFLLGTNSERVLHHAPCSVLVVHGVPLEKWTGH